MSKIRSIFNKKLLLILFLILSMLVIRLTYLSSSEIFLDSDESLIGVMGIHISEGRHVPIFAYGQAYKGTLESITHALFFKVFEPSLFILKIVPFFYYLLAVLMICLLLKKHTSVNYLNYLALLIFPSLFPFLFFIKAGYGAEVVFLCFLFLFIFFKFKETRNISYIYSLSFIAGFAIYLQIISLLFFLVVLFIGILDKQVYVKQLSLGVKNYLIFILSFILGISPIIIFNITYNVNYAVNFKIDLFGNFFNKFELIVYEILPAFFGGVGSGGQHLSYFSLAEVVLVVLSVASVLFVVVKYWQYILSIITFKKRNYSLQVYLLIIFISYFFIIFISPYTTDIYSVRYLILVAPILPILMSIAYSSLKSKSGVMANGYFALVIICGFISLSQIMFIDGEKNSKLFKLFTTSSKYGELISFLNSNNIKYGYADYWDQWNINFISKEKLQLAAFEPGDYWRNRYIPYYKMARESMSPVYIYRKTLFDKQNNGLLDRLPRGYKKEEIDNFVVIYGAGL